MFKTVVEECRLCSLWVACLDSERKFKDKETIWASSQKINGGMGISEALRNPTSSDASSLQRLAENPSENGGKRWGSVA